MVHLVRQCELKHSHFCDLSTIKSGQKLVEALGPEASDLITARNERGSQQRDNSVLRRHDSDLGVRRFGQKPSQIRVVATDFADQHPLRFDHVIKQFEHAARLRRRAEIEFVFGDALSLSDQSLARVPPLREEFFDLGHNSYSIFKPCPSLRDVSIKNVALAPSRGVLTPGGKNRRPFSSRQSRSTIRLASPVTGSNVAARDAERWPRSRGCRLRGLSIWRPRLPGSTPPPATGSARRAGHTAARSRPNRSACNSTPRHGRPQSPPA